MDIYDRGEVIKKLRKEHGYSQKRLAAKLNVSEAMISKYEANQSTPPLDTMCTISRIFNVSMDDLCGIKHQGTLSTHGLTEMQTETVKDLIEQYRLKNAQAPRHTTPEQYEVLGKITTELTK